MSLIRVALVGSSSTGKTTVYELLKNKLSGFNFVNESTRTVHAYGFDINEKGTDATQLAISSFHLKALLIENNTVYDRGYLDLLAYSKFVDIRSGTYSFIHNIWEQIKYNYTHYVYFPIEFKSVDDGLRSVNEDWRTLIDQEIFKILEGMGIDYLTVSGSPLQRVDQIIKFITHG